MFLKFQKKRKRENEYGRFTIGVKILLKNKKFNLKKKGVKINYINFLINNCAWETRERNQCSA